MRCRAAAQRFSISIMSREKLALYTLAFNSIAGFIVFDISRHLIGSLFRARAN